MKATTNRYFSSVTVRSLKIVGILLIVSTLIDFFVLAIPFNLTARAWQMGLTSKLVDRGIVPMVGIALLLIGSWIEMSLGSGQNLSKPLLDIKIWAVGLACFLGLLYLLLFPLHLINTRSERQEALAQINQQAIQLESQLEQQIGSEAFREEVLRRQNLLKSQLSSLLSNEEQLNQALQSQQLSPQLKTVLEQSRTNPQVLEQFLAQQAQQLPSQLLEEIRTQQQQLEAETKTRTLKSSLQTGISSLLLAIGYTAIGWTGIRNLVIRAGRRQPTA